MASLRKNILIINDSGISGGGAEERVRLLIDKFIDERCFDNIYFLCIDDCGIAWKDAIHFYTCPSEKDLAAKFIDGIIRENNINIIQLHNVNQLITPLMQVLKKYEIPVLWFAHDYWVLCGKRSMVDPLRAREMENCKKVSFLKCMACEGIKDYLHLKRIRNLIDRIDLAVAPAVRIKEIFIANNILKGRWRVVVPWIDDNFYRANSSISRNSNIVFIGPLADYKGSWVLARALRHISSEIPSAKLIFIGPEQEKNNPFRIKIEAVGRLDNTLDKMVFAGFKNKGELREVYQNSAVLVFPSVWEEPFGLIWAEALLCGCPVAASDIGGISENLRNGGFLFQPRNAGELAEKVLMILKDKNVSGKLSIEGQRYAANLFTIERAYKDMVKIYEELLK